MQLTIDLLKELAGVAITAAREAGGLISSYSERSYTVQHKAGCESLATQVVTEVDDLSQQLVLKHLEPTLARYSLALLTEESPDDGSRFEKDYFWCIDPLDGTLPFTQRQPGYAVSIALVSKSGEPMVGVIYDPVEDVLYDSIQGAGVRRNGQSYRAPATVGGRAEQPLQFYCDCSFEMHPDRVRVETGIRRASEIMGYQGFVIHMGGGAVMNACHVFENPPACYFKQPKMKAGGGSIWDFAATASIFAELDRPISDFHGEPLDLNRSDSTFMNHRGVCYTTDPELRVALAAVFAESR